MTPPLIRPRELRFVSQELWPLTALLAYPRFSAHTPDTFESVLDLSRRLALEKFAPHNRASDAEEPRLVDGRVRIIPEVKQALDAYAEAGFTALLADEADGGMQLPYTLALLCDAMFLGGQRRHHRLRAARARRRQPARRAWRRRSSSACSCSRCCEGRFLGTMCLSRAAGRLLARRHRHPRRAGRPTAAIACAARRCGSPAATTSSPRTSCTWCWRRSPARRPA